MKRSGAVLILFILFFGTMFSQTSDPTLRRIGYLTGNAISLSVFNDGGVAGYNLGADVRGKWGEYSYIGEGTPMVGIELINKRGDTIRSVIISRGSRSGQSQEKSPKDGHFWGFNPVTGFLNPSQSSIALNTLPASWPSTWADHPEYGSNRWNGLFGPDSMVADLEAYFRMDDAWDDEFNTHFLPDSTDTTKKGFGINVAVRYFQLVHSVYNDVLIKLYDVTNTGTCTYNKVVLGAIMGGCIGGDTDCGDERVSYDRQFNYITFWDNNGKGNKGTPTGIMAEGFLETPGNRYDGIDNDGDSYDPASPSFLLTDFDAKIYNIGDYVVLIDKNTSVRSLHLIAASVETVTTMGRSVRIEAGVTQFREGQVTATQSGCYIPDPSSYDGFDNDLDGLIDENQALYYETRVSQSLPAIKYKNYFTNEGVGDPMTDEPRDEIGFASFTSLSQLTAPMMYDDYALWKRMIPGQFSVTASPPQVCDYIYGTNYFSLSPGETRRFASVIAFGMTQDEVRQKVLATRALWNSRFHFDTLTNAVTFPDLNFHRTLTGTENLTWSSLNTGGTVDLWYSADYGDTWTLIAPSVPNTGSFALNTTGLEEASFGILKAYMKDEQGEIYGYTQSHDLTINNASNGKPFLRLLDQGFNEDSLVSGDSLHMQCLLGDPDNDILTLKYYYSVDSGMTFWDYRTETVSGDTLPVILSVPLDLLPNSKHEMIKIEIADSNYSASVMTSTFQKFSSHDTVSKARTGIVSGYAESSWNITILDSSKLTGHDYRITFDDRDSISYKKKISVTDATANHTIIDRQACLSGLEFPAFDGLAFSSEDIVTTLDSARTHWRTPVPEATVSFTVFKWATSGGGTAYNGYPMPNDYAIYFYPSTVDTSLADTLYPPIASNRIPAQATTFRVKNLSTNQFIKFCYRVNTASNSRNYVIYFKEQFFGMMKRTWSLTLLYNSSTATLPTDDTLYLYLKKGFSLYDTLRVFNVTTDAGSSQQLPSKYSLEQNYPNPFNPSTVIRYAVPATGLVTLTVYDILGREVATLVNQMQTPGTYTVTWNPVSLSSGLYFYRLHAGNFVETKKLLLIR